MARSNLGRITICLGLMAAAGSQIAAEERPLQRLAKTLHPVPSLLVSGGDWGDPTAGLRISPLFSSPFEHSAEDSPGVDQDVSTRTLPIARLPAEQRLGAAASSPDGDHLCVPHGCDGCGRQKLLQRQGCRCGVTTGGWLSAGYHASGNDLFNNRPDQFALHQGWIYAEKRATENAPWGFRADLAYGIDAQDTQAFGNPRGSWDFQNGFDHGSYGWTIPQAYAETLAGEWTLKIGHFFTVAGYEVVAAPDNFFYSHAMTMVNSEPFTHTGVLASRSLGSIEVFAGWTLGWDTGFENLNDGSSWLGGTRIPLGEDATLTSISTAGNLGWRGDDGYSHSLVLETALTCQLHWVLQSDILRVDATGEDNFGLNNYLLYSLNDCISWGARFEWWKGDILTGYAPHGGVLPMSGSLSYYAATFGLNIRPSSQLVLRPEVRTDWSPAAGYEQTYFGVDAILRY